MWADILARSPKRWLDAFKLGGQASGVAWDRWHYLFDKAYGRVVHHRTFAAPFFANGWGGERLVELEEIAQLMYTQAVTKATPWPPAQLSIPLETIGLSDRCIVQDAKFPAPCDAKLLAALPPESRTARIRVIRALDTTPDAPCVLHLAGTGDHGFSRRSKLGARLVRRGISSIILESPFYGSRRPPDQPGCKLRHVADLLALGRATIEESRCLLNWMSTEGGFRKLCIAGLSMGGVHAAMVAALHEVHVAVVPLLAAHSAAPVFCEGVLSNATAWQALSDTPEGIEAARERLRRVLSITDITKLPGPCRPDAVVFVAATNDAYIPRHSVMALQQAWPGSEIRWVTGGHVSSFILHNNAFEKAIVDALDRL
eukprot:jgi/Chlat1/7104/Chrsp57S06790